MVELEPNIPEPEDAWSNAKKLAYISREIQRAVDIKAEAELYQRFARRGGKDTIYFGGDETDYLYVLSSAGNRVREMADKIRDPFLSDGIRILYNNWDKISAYLLTPSSEREALGTGEHQHAYFDMITGGVGSACLAARLSGQDITISFNGIELTATPETKPADLQQQYFDLGDVRREKALAEVALDA